MPIPTLYSSVCLGTNYYSYWRTNVLARYDKKYLISSGFFTSILVPHVTTDRKKKFAQFEKEAINNGGNENSARKARYVLSYTQ